MRASCGSDDSGFAVVAFILLMAIACFVLCGFFCGHYGVYLGKSQMQDQATERGFAHHDSLTGEWQWNEPAEASEE